MLSNTRRPGRRDQRTEGRDQRAEIKSRSKTKSRKRSKSRSTSRIRNTKRRGVGSFS
jgi:hypothetical protein